MHRMVSQTGWLLLLLIIFQLSGCSTEGLERYSSCLRASTISISAVTQVRETIGRVWDEDKRHMNECVPSLHMEPQIDVKVGIFSV